MQTSIATDLVFSLSPDVFHIRVDHVGLLCVVNESVGLIAYNNALPQIWYVIN